MDVVPLCAGGYAVEKMERWHPDDAALRSIEERTLIEMFAARMVALMPETAYAAARRQMMAADGALALLWSEVALEITRLSFEQERGG